MMLLTSLFLRLGLGDRLAKGLSILVVVVVLLGAAWALRADAYRDGVRATDAKWAEASRRLERQARQSASKADDTAADRLRDHVEQVEQERERLDEAERNGTSPLDVLFGG